MSKTIQVSDEVYRALDELRWEERFRSLNSAIEFLLKTVGVEPFDEIMEDCEE